MLVSVITHKAMNRSMTFYVPEKQEWVNYKREVLNSSNSVTLDDGDEHRSSVYLLASYMPAILLHLTEPNLTWCEDVDLLKRHITRINVGSSVLVTDTCVMGPQVHCAYAPLDERATRYLENFGREVSNGIRWILQIYQTTNILQQHELFDVDKAVAKSINNKITYDGYTPVQLVTKLKENTECDNLNPCTSVDKQLYKQPFGYTSGAVPIGSTGRFTRPFPRPHIGAAPVTGFCRTEKSAVSDPYVLGDEESERLQGLIAKNRELNANTFFANMYRPTNKPPTGNTQNITPSCDTTEHMTGNKHNHREENYVIQEKSLIDFEDQQRNQAINTIQDNLTPFLNFNKNFDASEASLEDVTMDIESNIDFHKLANVANN